MRRLLIAFALLVLPPAPAGAEDLALCAEGQKAYNARSYGLAIAELSRCLESDELSSGNRAFLHDKRGRAYEYTSDTDRAIADYTEALRLDPEYVIAYNNRGNVYRDRGDYDRAIADYDRALQLNADYARGYRNRGLASRLKGDLERAISDYDRALDLDPDYVGVYKDRGDAYYEKGNYVLAIVNYVRVLRLAFDKLKARFD